MLFSVSESIVTDILSIWIIGTDTGRGLYFTSGKPMAGRYVWDIVRKLFFRPCNGLNRIMSLQLFKDLRGHRACHCDSGDMVKSKLWVSKAVRRVSGYVCL